jgi:hypothetical protein
LSTASPWIPGTAVFAPWTPHPSLAAAGGAVRPEIVWSALDCPALWALLLTSAPDAPEHVVSGRFTAGICAPVPVDQPCIITAWPVGRQGRKIIAGAALSDQHGRLLASCEQTCVVVDAGVPIGMDRWRS